MGKPGGCRYSINGGEGEVEPDQLRVGIYLWRGSVIGVGIPILTIATSAYDV